MSHYAFIFCLNLSVEFLVVISILGSKFWQRVLPMVFLLNLATHPLLWWYLPIFPGTYLMKLSMAEVLVAIVEVSLSMFFLRAHFPRIKIGSAVLAANLATFFMTFLV